MSETIKPEFMEVIEYVKKSGGATFADLENRFGWLGGGDYVMDIPEQNLLMWLGLSDAGVEFYTDLNVKKHIQAGLCSWILYADGGKIPNLPVAKRVPKGGYKKRRWAPVIFTEKKDYGPKPDYYPEDE